MAEIIQIHKSEINPDEIVINTRCTADDLYSASSSLFAMYLNSLPQDINKGTVMMQFLSDVSLMVDENSIEKASNIIIPNQSIN